MDYHGEIARHLMKGIPKVYVMTQSESFKEHINIDSFKICFPEYSPSTVASLSSSVEPHHESIMKFLEDRTRFSVFSPQAQEEYFSAMTAYENRMAEYLRSQAKAARLAKEESERLAEAIRQTVRSMAIEDIRKEVKSYGADSQDYTNDSEWMAALMYARVRDMPKPKQQPSAPPPAADYATIMHEYRREKYECRRKEFDCYIKSVTEETVTMTIEEVRKKVEGCCGDDSYHMETCMEKEDLVAVLIQTLKKRAPQPPDVHYTGDEMMNENETKIVVINFIEPNLMKTVLEHLEQVAFNIWQQSYEGFAFS